MTRAPVLVTSSIVKKMNAGPGGKTLRFGGAVMVNDLRSFESFDVINTSRALEWKAWLENPKSMSATGERYRISIAISRKRYV